MKTITRSLFLSVSVVWLLVCVGWGQQPAETIKSLKEQLQQLEKIENDPATPAEVRNINRQFMEERNRRLRSLLQTRILALRKYQSSVALVLNADEKRTLESAIKELEDVLRGFEEHSGIRTASASVPDNSFPSIAEMQASTGPATVVSNGGAAPVNLSADVVSPNQNCPDKIISAEVVPLISQNVPFQVEIKLSVPLDQSSMPNSQRAPGAGMIELITTTGVRFTQADLNYDAPSGFDDKTIILTRREGINKSIAIEDKEMTVSLRGFKFKDGQTVVECNAQKTAKILTGPEKVKSLEEARKSLADAVAHAKTAEEKDIFAGFAVAKGDGNSAAGAADININRTIFGDGETRQGLFDLANVALQIKKSSAENADPRHVNLALTFQKTMLLGRDARGADNDRRLGTANKSEWLDPDKQEALRNSYSHFFRGFLIDESLMLEGEAFDFKTVNFVGDTQFQLASISKRIGGTNGFWNLRLFTGPELGRNLSKPEAQAITGGMGTMTGDTMISSATAMLLDKVNWIKRYKTGGKLTLRYLPVDNTGSQWGIELDLGYVNRHLFNDEVATEAAKVGGKDTIKTINVVKGNKAWRQADLKMFFFSDEKARYGFKLSYSHGQLPPTFTFAKGFQFGFLVESKDDKSNGASVNANK